MLNVMSRRWGVTGCVAGFLLSGVCHAAQVVPLSSLDLSKMSQGRGRPRVDKSASGQPMSIGGRSFKQGVGTHARSERA